MVESVCDRTSPIALLHIAHHGSWIMLRGWTKATTSRRIEREDIALSQVHPILAPHIQDLAIAFDLDPCAAPVKPTEKAAGANRTRSE